MAETKTEKKIKELEERIAGCEKNVQWAIYLPVLFESMGDNQQIEEIKAALILKAIGSLSEMQGGFAEILSKVDADTR